MILFRFPNPQNLDQDTFTLEAWVHPDSAGTNPVFCKGEPGGPFAQFQLWVTEEGKLAFYHYLAEAVDHLDDGSQAAEDAQAQLSEEGHLIDEKVLSIVSFKSIPAGSFSHIAVSINESGQFDHDGNPNTADKTFFQGEILH